MLIKKEEPRQKELAAKAAEFMALQAQAEAVSFTFIRVFIFVSN